MQLQSKLIIENCIQNEHTQKRTIFKGKFNSKSTNYIFIVGI